MSRFETFKTKCLRWYHYATTGVWTDTRRNWKVDLVKMVNLSVRSFMDKELQIRASALTYQTMLAVVPALAMIFAIGRGFGFQNMLQSQIFRYIPAQREALEEAFKFVDSYLSTSSEGIFVGIGLIFLLWTLFFLMSEVEDAFNTIWGVTHGRSWWRKLTDYTAFYLMLPILIIISGGITVFMSSVLQEALPFKFMSPLLGSLLDFASLALIWLFLAGTYFLMPNTHVRFKNAFFAGVLSGTAIAILQWLFVSGQIYVTRYNAIYGSFAFLPLLLIWMYLVWIITLSGAVFCFASQNIFEFSFTDETARISESYRQKILLAVINIIAVRFAKGKSPISEHAIAMAYGLPVTLVVDAVNKLRDCRLVNRVVNTPGHEVGTYVPAVALKDLTVGRVLRATLNHGTKGFIPRFNSNFADVVKTMDTLEGLTLQEADKISVASLEIRLSPAEDPRLNLAKHTSKSS